MKAIAHVLCSCWVLVPLLLAGCASVKVPLCPTIARSSYGPGESASPVNKMVLEEVKRSNLELRQLSWFAAEVSGASNSVKRLEDNYAHLVCAFDPALHPASAIRQDFLSCMKHANEWVRIVQSPRPEELMATQTLFLENCAIRK